MPQQTEGCDQSKQNDSPQGPIEKIDSTCLIDGRCFWSVAVMLYKQMHVMICARAVSALGPPVTHMMANGTRNRRGLGLHLLSHGLSFTWL